MSSHCIQNMWQTERERDVKSTVCIMRSLSLCSAYVARFACFAVPGARLSHIGGIHKHTRATAIARPSPPPFHCDLCDIKHAYAFGWFIAQMRISRMIFGGMNSLLVASERSTATSIMFQTPPTANRSTNVWWWRTRSFSVSECSNACVSQSYAAY